MKTRSSKLLRFISALCLALAGTPGFGQAPVISSFSQNGELVCTNLLPGTIAAVEWAPSITGPWTNNWAGLDAVTVDTNGMIRVSVPMFYRVCGVAAPTGMALISAGTFAMGDTFSEGDSDEQPTNSVHVGAFYMDRTEVTKAMWDDVYPWATHNGYSFANSGSSKAPNHPVHSVNWFDAVKWCNARSEKEGRVPAYYTEAAQLHVYRTGQMDIQTDGVKWNTGYRLPTEAEWEKAARGGGAGARFPWADTDTISHSRANYNADGAFGYDLSYPAGYHPSFQAGGSDAAPFTSPNGYFAANGYGLYDVAGNVCEWCWDWYGSYSALSASDPRGPASGVYRVRRGGCWYAMPTWCRTAKRDHEFGANTDHRIGFRAVLPPSQP